MTMTRLRPDSGSGAAAVAAAVAVDSSGFDGVLSAADSTVQAALETLDRLPAGGGPEFHPFVLIGA